ncbi:MAG: reverse transcriptase domain-containing protein [Candidatus Dadabacteria bacterium]|nr:reverse transcriptase domain-containing protein [Candidatus Dadabacteria bacterium]
MSNAASLSPLLGAFYLLDLDRKMERLDVKYVRYMDDILILAKTRWKLKKAIKVLNQTFDELKLGKHPDKTVIGRAEKGFDFLGYNISPEGLSLAKKTIENFIGRAIRLYEQEPREGFASPQLGLYVRRWVQWTRAGIRPPRLMWAAQHRPPQGVASRVPVRGVCNCVV